MNILTGHFGGPSDVNESPWVTLNNDQIKNLMVTPVKLLDAPEPHRIITPLAGMFILDASAGAYDSGNVAGAVVNIGLGTTLSQIAFNQYLQATNYDLILPLADISLTMIADRSFTRSFDGERMPLAISMVTDASTPLTGGNFVNTLKVKVWYSVVPL